VLEADEVQGNVLYAYGHEFPKARYVLGTFGPDGAEQVRGWLRAATFGRRPCDGADAAWSDRPHVNVALTYRGLRRLGVPEELLRAFPEDFREGAAARAAGNGDPDPSGWRDGLGTGDVLLLVHAKDAQGCDDRVGELLRDGAVGVLHDRAAALVTTEGAPADPTPERCPVDRTREHFGFADGCAQPAVDGVAGTDPVGGGLYARTGPTWPRWLRRLEELGEDLGLKRIRRRWRPIAAGEFVLGYVNEDGRLPTGPPAPLGPNGTFMVYRELAQDVDGFAAYVTRHAERADLDEELLAAKIVGRWRDGTPLALSPAHRNTEIASNKRRANDFLYGNDPEGLDCPIGAHARRVNPRDGLPGGAERTRRHRIIRRGMPYTADDGEKGLAFICCGANIADGFEFIQRAWCNTGEALGLGRERDLLLQQSADGELNGMAFPLRGGGAVVLPPPPKPFVTVRGCEYLFVPSRRTCAWLATLA
jgi:Dyp-type peroxidase family